MMKYQVLQSFRTFFLSYITLLSGFILIAGFSSRKPAERLHVRIFTPTPRDSIRLKKFVFKFKGEKGGKYIDATVSQNELTKITSSGFKVAFISSSKKNSSIPPSYRPLDEIEDKLLSLRLKYPDIISVEKIGESTALRQPIWGVKVSDHVTKREDEPRILFMGVHHAREPIGAKICLKIINTLCSKYAKDVKIRNWVDRMEIWFVPVVNPDGYKYVLENNLSFPWWRKNLRDNDKDGVFNPLYDGVDLNRNYDYNWSEGGDGKPSSWFYRGSQPFSEKETLAIMKLAMRENFVIGISYHSYGESILFPWGNYKRPPDLELIVDIASAMAAKIKKQSGRGKYSILPLNGRVGQSSIWMYGQLRVLDYIVEVGTEYFPDEESIPFILKENLNGAFYAFERVLETGIRGHIFDANTRQPLLAEVEVKQFSAEHIKPRKTDAQFGSFYRLLNPGNFTLEIKSKGYVSKIIKNVNVRKGRFVDLEVGLHNKQKSLTNGVSH
ncbi:MAG: M14 family zinc carboxypeptidase [bacterium]